jgi:GTP-binding protein HflX
LRRIQHLYRRRVPQEQVVTLELARSLCEISEEVGRQMGVLLDRNGHVAFVVVGDSHKIELPDLGRARAGPSRLRGLRLVHTHLRSEPLSRDDLTDLALLRLDLVAALGLDGQGLPAAVHCAHLLPDNPQGQIWRILEPVPLPRLTLDFAEMIRSLEEEFARKAPLRRAGDRPERALLVHLFIGPVPDAEERVAELRELARTASLQVLGTVVQRRAQADPRTLIGKGKLEDLVLRALQLGADLLVFDQNLTPSQARNVADLCDLKVIDRTQLILDIFARRAHSRDGKIQVELAQLRYLFPRLAMKQEALSRLTGGIGGQGPGETTLEIHRRRARDRLNRLEKEIALLSRGRGVRRARRKERQVPLVAIVGYTNAGKSTLFNTLTNANVLVEDRLFATLDPTRRRLRFPEDREIILTDTVGFIRDLPPDLIQAFRATLEELYDADLLLHVCDVADPFLDGRIASVEKILREMGLDRIPRILVYNKMDLLLPEQVAHLSRETGAIPICALEAESTRRLLEVMETRLWRPANGTVAAPGQPSGEPARDDPRDKTALAEPPQRARPTAAR